MNYRDSVLLSHESIATAGTRTLDLTVKDIISRIDIQVKATNNGSTPTAHPASIISKIELVDGSDVLFGLSGAQALALQFYDQKMTPFCINNYLDDVMNVTSYQINFGRWLWDEQLAFDPNKFINPQIKVTHNLAAGGSSPDAATLEINLKMFDQKEVAPVGFLMNKEIVGYTLVASANERVDLPLDYDIRKILVLSLSAGKQPWEQYNEIKISEDNDKRIPVNDKTSDLVKYLAQDYGYLLEYIVGATGTTAVNHFMMSAYEAICAAVATDSADRYISSDLAYGGRIPIRGSAATNFMAHVRGLCPFGATPVPFGRPDDMEDWYKTSDIKKLELVLKAGSSPGSSSTCEVVAQQLRSYPTT